MSFSTSKSLGVLSLAILTTASVIPDINSSAASTSLLDRRDNPWPYGVIGDSWASGVSYNKDVLYDDNKDHCLRTKESHGPQLEGDNTWTGDSSGLRDAACSGSRLVDLAYGDHQMGKIGNPNVVVMTSGGNNAAFGAIVDLCLYHHDPWHNYGPAYKDDKDGTGDCAKSLHDSDDYISKTLEGDLTATITDIFKDDAVKNNPDFLLYLTGYAQFFSPDYPDWCNNEAWNIWSPVTPTPYLSKELRTEFNRQVSKVNQIYRDTVKNQFSDKVRYIDLDARFDGHRFCEANATHADQLNTDTHFENIYLWNLNWSWEVAGQAPPAGAIGSNGQVTPEMAQKQFGGQGVTAWDIKTTEDPGNVPENGWRLRPMHPRYSGYTRIKDAILSQLKADGLPKTAPTATKPSPQSPSPPAPTCSHVGDGFHCQCSDGSTPDPDEDNRCCLYHQPNGNDQCFSG